jgi:phosphoserine aminotransferase
MSRIYNFSAGPSTLPLAALEQAQSELLDYRGTGMSIMEMSHRAPEYAEVHDGAVSLVRELLGVPDDYHVLFLQGGATLQFAMVPLNLLGDGRGCAITLSGSWAKKAYADARLVGPVQVVFDGAPTSFTTLPDPAELDVDPSAAYLHVTSNETIGGVQWKTWPETKVPLVADMSSDFLSRALPIERFGLIYAGAQKNLGPAGATVVILRDDLLQSCNDTLGAYLSYKTHVKAKGGLFNTPPSFAVYMCRLSMEWLKARGGVAAAARWAEERYDLLARAISGSGGFYRNPVPEEFRSRMNVVFRLPSEELEKRFIAEALEQGLRELKGHRSVGGCRASLYNAMPLEGAKALADFMDHFAAKHG